MLEELKVGDRVKETREGAIQHDRWIGSESTGRTRALKEGIIERLTERFLVGGKDALIRWSDGTISSRVASGEHLAKIVSLPSSIETRLAGVSGSCREDLASLKNYFSIGQRVIETRARCRRIHEGYLGIFAKRSTGKILRWKEDNENLVVEWDTGIPTRVLASKQEIIRIADAFDDSPQLIARLVKYLAKEPRYQWTAWRVGGSFFALNGDEHTPSPTNVKLFDSATDLQNFLCFLKSVGYQELADPQTFESLRRASYHEDYDCDDGNAVSPWDDTIYVGRMEEYDDYQYWSGDPDWDN